MEGEVTEGQQVPNLGETQPSSPNPETEGRSELETRVVTLFEQLPNLTQSEVFDGMSEVNDMLTRSGIPQDERQKRLRSIAEGVVSYKSGYERVEGEVEGPWFLGEEKAFREALVQHGLVPREFVKIPLGQAIPRAIGEATGVAIGSAMDATRNPITRKLWEINAKLWRKNVEMAKEIPKIWGATLRGEEYTPPAKRNQPPPAPPTNQS